MSLIATLALATSAALPSCSWDHPGNNPFMGDVIAAVDDYKDIPAATRAKLKARMAKLDFDEFVVIDRDHVSGVAQYGSQITDMHFGTSGMCKTVTRQKWGPKMQERGLVYCEDGQCILVPTVCRNVSRIKREDNSPLTIAPGAGVAAAPSDPAAAGGPTALPASATDAPLEFAAPGAGLPGSFSAPVPSAPPTTALPSAPAPAAPAPNFPLLPPTATATTQSVAPSVPEPATRLMFGVGLLLTGVAKRRRG